MCIRDRIGEVAGTVDLIVNSTIKGQSGLRSSSGDCITCLGPCSALGQASPAVIAESESKDVPHAQHAIYEQSISDNVRNLQISSDIMGCVPASTCFVDLIYSPLDTPMLAQARASGHRTLNGRGLIIAQAADAFVNKALAQHLTGSGWELEKAYQRVFATMERRTGSSTSFSLDCTNFSGTPNNSTVFLTNCVSRLKSCGSADN